MGHVTQATPHYG